MRKPPVSSRVTRTGDEEEQRTGQKKNCGCPAGKWQWDRLKRGEVTGSECCDQRHEDPEVSYCWWRAQGSGLTGPLWSSTEGSLKSCTWGGITRRLVANQLGHSAARKGPGPPGGKEGECEAATCPCRERLKVIQGKRILQHHPKS